MSLVYTGLKGLIDDINNGILCYDPQEKVFLKLEKREHYLRELSTYDNFRLSSMLNNNMFKIYQDNHKSYRIYVVFSTMKLLWMHYCETAFPPDCAII